MHMHAIITKINKLMYWFHINMQKTQYISAVKIRMLTQVINFSSLMALEKYLTQSTQGQS